MFLPKTETDFEIVYQAATNSSANYTEYYTEENRNLSIDITDPEQTKFHTDKDNFDCETHVQVRLLWSIDLPYDFETNKINETPSTINEFEHNSNFNGFACFSCIGGRKPQPVIPEIHEIVIHIHGGGFVGMSSNAHQNVTRKWANKINIPIFSIDYGCAPEFPYPRGLEDCWQAYKWIIQYSKIHLGIKPNRIILVGDSAGGNFCCGVTTLAIQNNFRVPDCLILAYPALDLSTERFYPSYLLGINDFMLNLIMIKIFQDAYLHEKWDPENDPLLSPFVIPDDVLERFPKIRILSASCDPLRDQAIKFTNR